MRIIVDYLSSHYAQSTGWSVTAHGRVTDPQIRTKFTVTKNKSNPITLKFTDSEAMSSLSEDTRRELALEVREVVYSQLQSKLQGFIDELPNLPKSGSS